MPQEGRRSLSIAAFAFLAAIGLAPSAPAMAGEQPGLRLCADPDNLPFSSDKAATPGFYVELGKALGDALGRSFQPVWVPTYYTKRQIRLKLLTGQCDGFVGVPDDPSFVTPRLVLSKPIVQLGYALVAPPASGINTVQDLHGHRVAVQFASPPQDLLATRNDVQTVTVLSPEEAMQDLATGKADAAFIWGPSAGWLNHTVAHDAFRVVPVSGDHMVWTAAIAFPRENARLRDQVNHALDGLDAKVNALALKYEFPGAKPAATPAQNAQHADNSTNQPAATPAESPAPATDAPPNPADVAAGRKLFNDNCAHCHGPDAIQGEQRRNLRLLRQRYGNDMSQMFMTTVTHGRVKKGMPNWSGIISNEEFQKILAFLKSVQDPGS
ncbi:MAG TPA: transporter substrate-binding domain-containing protein [Rhodopila sp.]|nr:transporter substrate-binding domain-containing protein [Rhodopila sp.]